MSPKEAEVLREYAEKLAAEQFPAAEVKANPHHQDGPIVEVKQGKRTKNFRLVDFEDVA